MTRRITLALTGVLALAGAVLLPGCASDHGGSRQVDGGTEYTVVVSNESKHAVDVAWTLAYRRHDDGELGRPAERSLGVISPQGVGRDGPVTFGMGPSQASDFVQVFRIRLTVPSASWQEPARMWWEVVGELPRTFIIENGPGPDGFLVKLRGEGAAIEAVPRQFWVGDDTRTDTK